MSAVKKRRDWSTLLAAAWLIALTILAFTADYLPFIRGYAESSPEGIGFSKGPSTSFLFGSDQLGRDIFARCIYGAQISLRIALFSIIIGTVVGGTLGMVAGFFGRASDRAISAFTDVMLAFPPIVIAILVTGRFDALRKNSDAFSWLSRTWSITFVLSILAIAPLARIVRAQTLSISQREFVLAARSLGARNGRVLVREILPNLVPAMVSVIFTGVAVLLIAEGGLAFLGYSIELPTPTWGRLIAENRNFIREAWWGTIMPCVMLFATVLSFNVLGDRIARRFDIREAAL
jgi:peptide/nickel transport system permease protein